MRIIALLLALLLPAGALGETFLRPPTEFDLVGAIRVVEAAQEATRAAATRLGRRVPEPGATEALFRAQIHAAVAIQHETLERAPAARPPPDLDRELRPALLRIGERIAELWVRLPIPLDPTTLRESAEQELSTPGLEPAAKQQLIEALVTAATAHSPLKPDRASTGLPGGA